MDTIEQLEEKFSKCCFVLTEDDIKELSETDNGPINNVMSGINKHCYGVKLFDDARGLTADFFYIDRHKELRGDLIQLDLNSVGYFALLFRFCVMIENDYSIDAIDSANHFQIQLRSFLEKLGFFTITSQELKPYEGSQSTMYTARERGFFHLHLIDKVEFLRNIFSHTDERSDSETQLNFVYLMVNTETSLIKIGRSKRPGYRERTLHSQEPTVHLIAKWECSREYETRLHQKYKDQRVRGEWFRLSLNDLKEIESMMRLAR